MSQLTKRCSSLNSLIENSFPEKPSSRSASESSSALYANSETEASIEELEVEDEKSEVLSALEAKIDRLNDLFLEQCQLLSDIKSEVLASKPMLQPPEVAQNQFIIDLLKKALQQITAKARELETNPEEDEWGSRARSLLDAIENNRAVCLDREIRDALVEFLQGDELKRHVVSATVDSLKGMVRAHFTRDVSSMYLPLLEQSHRRLAKHVARVLDASFMQLEQHSASFAHSIYRTSRSLRRALEKHQGLLENAGLGNLRDLVEEVLHKEMKDWRKEALTALCPKEEWQPEPPYSLEDQSSEPYPLEDIPSPTQPADPSVSIVDQLMRHAEINALLEAGDFNACMERALSWADLGAVVVACRAAAPAGVARLHQPVLLALLQQLATDMLHDTSLKCRYMEEALLNLDTTHPVTKANLALVVSEVRKHLSHFIAKYPKHLATRRIKLIIMAADNLLK